MKTNFLNRLRLWQKFALLGIFAFIAVLLPTYQTFNTEQAAIDFALEEKRGLLPINAQLATLQALQLHRGITSAALGGDATQKAAQAAKQAEVDKAILQVDTQLAADPRETLLKSWAQFKRDWALVSAASNKSDTRAEDSRMAHTALISQLLLLIEATADEYKLSLDPETTTYFLVQVATVHLPQLSETLGSLRYQGALQLTENARVKAGSAAGGTAGELAASNRQQITSGLSVLRTLTGTTYRFVDKAKAAEPRVKSALEAASLQAQKNALAMEALIKKEVLENTASTLEPGAFFAEMTKGIDEQFKFAQTTTLTLGQELSAQIAEKEKTRLTGLTAITVALALAILVAYLTLRNVSTTVASLQDAVGKVRTGDTEALQAIDSRDEIGDLGRLINTLLTERLEVQRKAESENLAINDSTISLLQTVFQLGDRDLTARAVVSEDIIGTVAASINQFASETSNTLMDVRAASEQVRDSSEAVRAQTETVENTLQKERVSLQKMAKSLVQTSSTLNDVAALSLTSNRAAQELATSTELALTAVGGTVRGMSELRESISEMEKRFKRLGERSQEISTAIGLVNTISERTHVLALNASMQAATAGEAGRGFAVVAEEVQRLSDSSRQATAQISQLVSNIQAETNETLFTVNRLISEVVKQSELAQSAGTQMQQTKDLTGQLVGLVRQISAFGEQQTLLAAALQGDIVELDKGTEQTSTAVSLQSEGSKALVGQAQRLTAAVSRFKLSEIGST